LRKKFTFTSRRERVKATTPRGEISRLSLIVTLWGLRYSADEDGVWTPDREQEISI
jgi:hypothetical protein